MARDKRSFGNIRRRSSGRYQVRFTDPDGRYITAPRASTQRLGLPTGAAKSTTRHTTRPRLPNPRGSRWATTPPHG
jgi:hypothetical protein